MSRCKNCNKPRDIHKAESFHCPLGRRTRAGYIFFSKESIYEEEKSQENRNSQGNCKPINGSYKKDKKEQE